MPPDDLRPHGDETGHEEEPDHRAGRPVSAARGFRGARVIAVLHEWDAGAPNDSPRAEADSNNTTVFPAAQRNEAAFPLAGCWSVPVLILYPLWRSRRSPLRKPARALIERLARWRMRRLARGASKVPPARKQ